MTRPLLPGAGVLRPGRYHGASRRPPFFEGWYAKLVSADERNRWAVIPGVFLAEDPRVAHSFVQVLDGRTGAASYHRFDVRAFSAADDRFAVEIGPNRFDEHGIVLALDGDEGEAAAGRRVHGEVAFGPLAPWPVTLASPGAMGPYAWVPRMECNHAVLSLDHALDGTLDVDGRRIDLTGGRGYLEKDWGAAFPAGYVWLQTNHLAAPGDSLVASIAVVPWMGGAFPGFLVGLRVGGRLHRFATWTVARTEQLSIEDDRISWTLRGLRSRLRLEATRARGGLLRAPTREHMGERVGETMLAEVSVELRGRGGAIRHTATGRNAGLEVHGDIDRLLALQRS